MKTFPKASSAALKGINVTCKEGQFIGLIGPDGAGKTTLLRLLAGLLKPTSGKIEILGFDPMKQEIALHQNIGYMPQRFGLYEDLSVLQNLNLYADLQGIEAKNKEELFQTLLRFTGLKPFVSRLARDLSGGMKQKLGLACVLLKKPKLLLLDEPSVGVDPISRRELWTMVSGLVKEKITVVWSTSYLDEAEKCDSVILLSDGELLYSGPPQEYTQRVAGQVVLLYPPKEKKRSLLATLSSSPSVLDSVIQSDALRAVLKENSPLPPLDPSIKVVPTAARFEDAFVQTLNKGPIQESKLAAQLALSSSGDDIVIEAKNVTKQFDHFTAVDNISFSVKKGEIFGLLGPNGAGKSTTFKILCGLLKATKGSAIVLGLSLDKAPSKARAQIGYMAQKFSLYGDLSCEQNLYFFSGIYPVPLLKRQEIIEEMIQTFDLKPFLAKPAKELPLGFKQRLALACCLMHRPKILFLDEPTSGVDPITRREFWGHINSLVSKGMTVMITTHFMDEAEYCDRIGLINKGKVIMLGSPDELKMKGATKENPTPTLEDAFIALSTQREKSP